MSDEEAAAGFSQWKQELKAELERQAEELRKKAAKDAVFWFALGAIAGAAFFGARTYNVTYTLPGKGMGARELDTAAA